MYTNTWVDGTGIHGTVGSQGSLTIRIADGKYDGWIWANSTDGGGVPDDIFAYIDALAKKWNFNLFLN